MLTGLSTFHRKDVAYLCKVKILLDCGMDVDTLRLLEIAEELLFEPDPYLRDLALRLADRSVLI